MTAIVWIRRNFRLKDNTALVKASRNHDEVLPLYIVDPNILEDPSMGYPRAKFWLESLKELKNKTSLTIRKGEPLEEIQKVIEQESIEKLYTNRDYSPYSRKRDKKISENVETGFKTCKDIVMHETNEILTNKGTPYEVFSYYYKKWSQKEKDKVRTAKSFETLKLESDKIPSLESFDLNEKRDIFEPGREEALEKMKDFKEKATSYNEKRDYPGSDNTSKLSPYLKFGNISIREVYWEFKELKKDFNDENILENIEEFIRQLAWRDFYFQVLFHHPETVERPLKKKYEQVEWISKEDSPYWESFVNGKTGYPFVDAGMRQLKKTGWMHNRLRMVVTSFAAKDLFIDWRDLHEFYKKNFVDAEIASMVGGIQWAYSNGADSQPYFRVFNPIKQGKDYDPEGEYIRKWVPELRDLDKEYIHEPFKMNRIQQNDQSFVVGEDYPKPIVDHQERKEEIVEQFKKASGN